jgi:transposase
MWLYALPMDMRKSYDSLTALVKNLLNEYPTGSHLFVFINRKCTQMKVLYFDRSGYCVWSKRLEQGRFQDWSNGTDKIVLDWTRLKLLLGGMDEREDGNTSVIPIHRFYRQGYNDDP